MMDLLGFKRLPLPPHEAPRKRISINLLFRLMRDHLALITSL